MTADSTGTDGRLWDAVDSQALLLATDTPPPYPEDFDPPSVFFSPQISPADQALARLTSPASSDSTNQRESPPMDTCDLRYDMSLGFLTVRSHCRCFSVLNLSFAALITVLWPWKWTAKRTASSQSLFFPRSRQMSTKAKTEWKPLVPPLTFLALAANPPRRVNPP